MNREKCEKNFQKVLDIELTPSCIISVGERYAKTLDDKKEQIL